MKKKYLYLGGALACLLPGMVSAEINFRGFGSIVGGMLLDEEGVSIYDAHGYDDEINFKRNSHIALQADAVLDDGLTATMQLMSRGRDEYDIVVEWAYLTYELNDNNQISLGRIRTPFYRYSDFLDVGYAYNWLQAPRTVYLFEFPGYDGLSYVGNFSLGPVDTSLQLIGGNLEGDLRAGESKFGAQFDNLVGSFLTFNYDWLTFRAGYLETEVTFDLGSTSQSIMGLGAMFDNFSVPGSPFPPVSIDSSGLTSAMLIDGDKGSFGGLALGIDWNNIVIDAEIISYELTESIIPETHGAFTTIGYRFGNVLPTFTIMKKWASPIEGRIYDEMNSISTVAGNTIMQMAAEATAAQLGAPVEVVLQDPTIQATGQQVAAGTLAQLQGTIVPLLKGQEIDEEEEGWDFTIRYDFDASATLKVSYLVRDRDRKENDVKLFRIGIDFVF